MYESFFGFQKRPFAAAPQADRYFAARAIEAAHQSLARCIERAEGAGLLIGPSGSGKTLLLQVLAEQFHSTFSVALLANGHLTTRRALLQAILYEMGLPYRGMEEGELRLALIDHVSSNTTCPSGMLLLVDEAHVLPLRLLEELRMITNLVRNGQPRVRLVLSGTSTLEERLASPKLESFSQRLRARCYLESFDRTETLAYVRAQVAMVGGKPDELFSAEALDSVFRATDGIPRLVNQVCDHALVLAYSNGRKHLAATEIDEAWADLQQLPTPWNESARTETAAVEKSESVLEFGQLDDEPSDVAVTPIVKENIGDEFGDAVQPATRLNQIAEHIAEFEQDFEPVGNIGPEAELTFTDTVDPFAESYADEEVVMDRYASADAVLGPRNKVRSSEGAALSALLKPFLQGEVSGPKLAIVHEATHGELRPQTAAPATAESPSVAAEAGLGWVDPADDPVMPDEPWEEVIPQAASIRRPQVDSIPAPTEPTTFGHTDDDNLMIVEDDPYPLTAGPAPAPKVRRQEYGQLFAKLRRG